jgi:hypothetical protein
MEGHQMEKLDLTKEDKEYYKAGKEPVLITLGPLPYLTIDGKGTPGDEEFQSTFGALYTVAYTLKFGYKAMGRDFAIVKLEGQYWGPAKEHAPGSISMQDLHWKMMIRMPEFVEASAVEAAKHEAREKKGSGLVDRVRLEVIDEGRCAQIMHVGPYDQEEETIARLLAFIAAQGLAPGGRHHEIYMSDPRRVAPEKIKTILRQPVRQDP